MYVCVCVWVYVCRYVCVWVCVCMYDMCMYACLCGNVCMYACIYIDRVCVYIKSVSRIVDITAGGDFLGLCDQKKFI